MEKMIKSIAVLLVAGCMSVISFHSAAYAQEVTDLTPSGIPYDEIQSKVDRFIEERKEGCASVSVAVFREDETLYSRQYGYSDVANKIAVNEDTVYEWGSVSKLLVWTSVMQLYERGKLDLNRDIKDYLPEHFLTKTSEKEPITMLNLMNHNAGWQETAYDVEEKDAKDIVDLETALQKTEPAQIYKPGTVTAYSNWGTALAAYIVQRVSGEKYTDYVQEHILQPLGMEHTSVASDFSDNEWVREQRKLLHCYSIMQDSYEEFGTSIRYILLYPAGSATGTLGDFTTFAKAFVPKAGEASPLFEKADTLELIKEATSYYGDSDIPRNCHGLWSLQYAQDIMGHNGNTSGCTSTLMFEPNTGLGVVVMTNEMGETAYNYGILSLLFGDYSKNVRVKEASKTESKDMSGIYTLSRTYEKGFCAIYKYMGSLMPLSQTKNNNTFKLSIGQGTLTYVGEHQYIMDNENGWRYLMYETKSADGNTVLQMMSADVVKENTIFFAGKAASFLLFLIIIIVSVIIILINVLGTIINKIREKEKTTNKWLYRRYILMSVANCLAGLVFYYLILLPLDGGSVKPVPVMIQCIILAFLSVCNLVVTGMIFKKWKQYHLTKKAKIKYMFMMGSSCYISVFIWYWQLFDFWSC